MILQDVSALERYLDHSILPDCAIVASADYVSVDMLRLLAQLNGYQVAWIFAHNANFYSALWQVNSSAVLYQGSIAVRPPPVALHRVRVCDALANSTILLGEPTATLTADEQILCNVLPSGWDTFALEAFWWQEYKLPTINRQLKRLSNGCGLYPYNLHTDIVLIHPTEPRPLYRGEYLALLAGQYGQWLEHVVRNHTGEQPPEAYQVGSEWIYDFTNIEPQNYPTDDPVPYIPFKVKP